jgi:hypothetical protein
MSSCRWDSVSYLDALRPEPGWETEFAFLASYSADLVALVAVLLALAGLDDDRGSGSKVDLATALDRLKDRVRLVAPRAERDERDGPCPQQAGARVHAA